MSGPDTINAAHNIAPGKPIDAQSLNERQQELAADADTIMLDELSLDDMRSAVALTASGVKLETSGRITDATLRMIAKTDMDYISLGTLTKDVKTVDLSMRLTL